MIKLIIEQPGLFIEFPGVSVRTPAEIDISRINIDLIISRLRGLGVTQYRIESDVNKKKEQKKPEQKELIKEKVIKEVDESSINEVLKKFLEYSGKRFDKIEKIISNMKLDNVDPEKQKVIKRTENKDETFIPKIDISGMKVKGTINKSSTDRDDLTGQIEALSKVKKGDGGFNK